MRFSSIVALVVVTVSFALAGCAADADPARSSTTDNVIHQGSADTDGKASEVRLIPKFGDEVPSHSLTDDAHVRVVDVQADSRVNPFEAPPHLGASHGTHGPSVMTAEQIEAVVDEHSTGNRKP